MGRQASAAMGDRCGSTLDHRHTCWLLIGHTGPHEGRNAIWQDTAADALHEEMPA